MGVISLFLSRAARSRASTRVLTNSSTSTSRWPISSAVRQAITRARRCLFALDDLAQGLCRGRSELLQLSRRVFGDLMPRLLVFATEVRIFKPAPERQLRNTDRRGGPLRWWGSSAVRQLPVHFSWGAFPRVLWRSSAFTCGHFECFLPSASNGQQVEDTRTARTKWPF
jgi:hypothetical protein